MIIAIKEKDRIVLGYSNADYVEELTDKDCMDKDNVAVKFTGDKAFACPYVSRYSDILLYDDDFLNEEITPKSIVKKLIPYIKSSLQENGKPLDEDGGWDNALVICSGNHVYDIDTGFGFYEVDDYVCHGANVATFKSVLDETTDLSAEQRIIKAVEFGKRLHKRSLFPLIITDTKTKRFKYIDEGENVNEHIDSL